MRSSACAAAGLVGALAAALCAEALRPDHACALDEPAWIQSGYLTFQLVRELAPPARWETTYDARGLGSYGNLYPPFGKLVIGALVAPLREPGDPLAYAWEWPLDHGENRARGNLPPDSLLRQVRLGIVALAALLLLLLYLLAARVTGAPWLSLLAPLSLFLSPIFRTHASQVYTDVPQLVLLAAAALAFERHLARDSHAALLCALGAMGLACAVKPNAAPLVGATGLFVLLRPAPWRRRLRQAALVAVLPLGVFVAVNPYLYADPPRRVAEMVAGWAEIKTAQRADPRLSAARVPSRSAGLALVARDTVLRPRLEHPRLLPLLPAARGLAAAFAAALLVLAWRQREDALAARTGLALALLVPAVALGVVGAAGAAVLLGLVALAARATGSADPARAGAAAYTLTSAATMALATGLWLPLSWPRYYLPVLVLLTPCYVASAWLAARLVARAARPRLAAPEPDAPLGAGPA